MEDHSSTSSISSPETIQLMASYSIPPLTSIVNIRYVDQTTAASGGLISEKGGVVYLAPDSTNVAPSGRKSVRLESKDSFNEVLIIADFSHIPKAYIPLP
jgi:hypothetical protein